MHPKLGILALVVVTMLVATAAAQAPPDPGPVVIGGPGFAAASAKGGLVGFHVENRMDAMDAAPVKGAPFCAAITTEHTQLFADGNRIHTTDNSTLCRDSEGRIRRESDLNLLGAAAQKSAAKLITIIDPVAGFRYLLDSDNKVAHRMPLPSSASTPAGSANAPSDVGVSTKGERMMIYRTADDPGPHVNVVYKSVGQASEGPPPTTENLGDQTIDGIHATGTRITTTIPSGQMGNDQPIVVTSERWYSPELKATVMTRHNDPWAGELKTRFTSVNTSEPDRSLFSVPSDYKIVDDKAGPFLFQAPDPPPPPQ